MPDVVQPVTIATEPGTPTFTNLNYTNQDYYSLKDRLRTLLRTQYADKFNDFFESSLGLMLVEMWAFIADTVNFKIDQMANELFIDTVTEVENAFRLAKLVGFAPTPPIAARAMFTASIGQVLDVDLEITGGVQLPISVDGEGLFYEIYAADSQGNPLYDDDIVISAGNFTNSSLVGLEGRTVRDVFTGDGTANQSYSMSQGPVILDSVRVNVDGIRWQEVPYFTDGNPRREFRLEYDSTYSGFAVFGNDRAGLVPSKGSVIEVVYRVGGGTRGNIITGFIDSQRNFVVPGLAFALPVAFTNYTKGEYGYDGDGIEDVRRKLPAWVRAQQRAVTGSDYKTLVEQFATAYHGQVGKAAVTLRNQGCAGNIIDIYVLARGAGDSLQTASDELKTDLVTKIESEKMLTDYVCIRDGKVILADVTLDVVVDKFFKKIREELQVKIVNRVSNFFTLNSWEFGKSLLAADVVKALSDMKELKGIDVTFTTDDPDNSGESVAASFDEIIRPDQIAIAFAFD